MHAAFLALAAVVIAAPVPKEKGKETYFPTTVGAKWVTEGVAGRKRMEVTETVTKVEEKDGTYLVTVVHDRSGTPETDVVQVSEKGVFLVSEAGVKLDAPVPLLKLPAKEGETWEVEDQTVGAVKRKYTTTCTMGKEEEIEVRGVKYKALKVTQEFTTPGAKQTTNCWYAPGVGRVKSETVAGSAGLGGKRQSN
jgi:hypothetical protein